MNRNSKGEVSVVVVIFLAGMAAGVFAGNWNPFYKMLGKEPPTQQVQAAQAKVEAARLEAEVKEAKLKEAAELERRQLEQQIQSAQQDNVGTLEALKRVPPEHTTAEVKLASAMATRVSLKLARAIGKLPADQQDAMILLIDQALSEKQSEVDEAHRKLAQRDKDFEELSKEHEVTLNKVIPALKKDTEAAKQKADQLSAELNTTTNTLSQWAKDKYESEARAHGLQASIDKLISTALWLGGIWAFVVYILPGLVKHMGPGRTKNFLRDVSGYITSPLLYHDAKRKLNAPSDDQS